MNITGTYNAESGERDIYRMITHMWDKKKRTEELVYRIALSRGSGKGDAKGRQSGTWGH